MKLLLDKLRLRNKVIQKHGSTREKLVSLSCCDLSVTASLRAQLLVVRAAQMLLDEFLI